MGPEVTFRADCQKDRSSNEQGAGDARNYLASTYRPMAVGPSTVEVSERGWYRSRDARSRSTGFGFCTHS